MEELLKSLYAKYYLALTKYRENVPWIRLDGKSYHESICDKESHRECWASGSRAKIMLEATSRFIYLITGTPTVWGSLKGKPKLREVTHYIVSNIDDISNTNYKYLMEVKDKLIEFGYGDKKKGR